MPRSKSNSRNPVSQLKACPSGFIRRKTSPRRCVSPKSKAGKRVLGARKASRTRKMNTLPKYAPLSPLSQPSPCRPLRKEVCLTDDGCSWRKNAGCYRKRRQRSPLLGSGSLLGSSIPEAPSSYARSPGYTRTVSPGIYPRQRKY